MVNVYEVWCRSILVEATSEEEATEKANETIESGSAIGETFEYSHTIDEGDWYVEKVSE